MKAQLRLANIKNAPFTMKEIDLLTGAERYLKEGLELPLVEFVSDCFPTVSPSVMIQIKQIWEYSLAAFQLTNKAVNEESKTFRLRAARMYELETQRILGALFPIAHPFWKNFYQRQETEQEKPLLALDALYHNTNNQAQINYQLLLQALKAILKAHYLEPQKQYQHYQIAKSLLMDMPLVEFHKWLNERMK